MRGVDVFVLAVLPVACYSPTYKDCVISCANNDCPSGFDCRAGMCRPSETTGTCSAMFEDAGHDTAINDSGSGQWVDPLGPWGAPMLVPLPLNGVVDPNLTPNLLEMYVMHQNWIYVTTRPNTGSAWLTPVTVSNVSGNAGLTDQTPSISADGLTLLFESTRTPAVGGQDIYVSTRQTAMMSSPWSSPVLLDHVNSIADDSGANMSTDEKVIVFSSARNDPTNGTLDIFIATRAAKGDPWGAPAPIQELETSFNETHPSITPDLLTMYFQSNRNGSTDLFVAHRKDLTMPFDTVHPIDELNTSSSDGDPWVSPDGHHMFFSSNRGSSALSIWESDR
jgi:WD40 repeat protein